MYTAINDDFNTFTLILDKYNPDITITNHKNETIYDIAKCSKDQRIIHYLYLYVLPEWRPWNHYTYPLSYRKTMKTLLLLAKI